jgi:hypothetical protein
VATKQRQANHGEQDMGPTELPERDDPFPEPELSADRKRCEYGAQNVSTTDLRAVEQQINRKRCEYGTRNVRALSIAIFIMGGIFGLSGVLCACGVSANSYTPLGERIGFSVFFITASIVLIVLGVGLRRFKKWAWLLGVMLAIPCIPLVFGVWWLYALLPARHLFYSEQDRLMAQRARSMF